ncbi:hypothetical protein SAMN03003324_02797 [Pedobacter antarcticus]|uniref:Uncharacterized protein n=1 Tax=Pedobacter antarcticus TaxID=34086 RepID=A0A1I2GT43_9SPHI|nr:hypothetical protein SAMN03003324_02797 [Pedobacter antarcticus]
MSRIILLSGFETNRSATLFSFVVLRGCDTVAIPLLYPWYTLWVKEGYRNGIATVYQGYINPPQIQSKCGRKEKLITTSFLTD